MARDKHFAAEWAWQERRSWRAVGEEVGFAWDGEAATQERFRFKNGKVSRYERHPLPAPTTFVLPRGVRA